MEEPGLTVKQRKWLHAYIETGNATEAARQAGYSERSAQQIGSENLLKLVPAVTRIMEMMELDNVSLLRKLKEGLSAEAVVTASFEGKITDERTFVDYGTRHRYLDMAFRLRGSYAATKTDVTSGDMPIKLYGIVSPDDL